MPALPPGIGPAARVQQLGGRRRAFAIGQAACSPTIRISISRAPGVWYLARIETPGLTLAGVTAPGTPFLVLGHNERIAWGFTTTGGDVEDLFVEKPDPADPTRYLAPGGSRPFATRAGADRGARRGEPVTLTVRETRHGPVISDLAGYAAAAATCWRSQTTWLGADDRTPDAIWRDEPRARDWDEFRAALENFVAPQQNIVYADIDGNIGFIAPARMPIRAKGDGWLPAPGWSGEYDWTGTVPFDAAAQRLQPAERPLRHRQQQDRARRLSLFPDAATGTCPIAPSASRRCSTRRRGNRRTASAAIQADDAVAAWRKELLPLMLATRPRRRSAPPTRSSGCSAGTGAWSATRSSRCSSSPGCASSTARSSPTSSAPLSPITGACGPMSCASILTEHRDWCDDPATPRRLLRRQLAAALDRALERAARSAMAPT